MTDRRTAIAERIARDLPPGSYVNLGIGIPTLVAKFIAEEDDIVFHTENGVLGFVGQRAGAPEDWDLIDAGKQLVTLRPGAAFFDHSLSFAMIRGGHLDFAVLGAFEVASNGDLASWSEEASSRLNAVGGAMDLAVGARSVLVAMTHTTSGGKPKLVAGCSLPLTARHAVTRVYTDRGVFRPRGDAFEVLELAEGTSAEELVATTAAKLVFPSPPDADKETGR